MIPEAATPNGSCAWLSRRAGILSGSSDELDSTCGRHGVEFVAVKQRLAHVRFQELLSMNERLLPQLTVNGKLAVPRQSDPRLVVVRHGRLRRGT